MTLGHLFGTMQWALGNLFGSRPDIRHSFYMARPALLIGIYHGYLFFFNFYDLWEGGGGIAAGANYKMEVTSENDFNCLKTG